MYNGAVFFVKKDKCWNSTGLLKNRVSVQRHFAIYHRTDKVLPEAPSCTFSFSIDQHLNHLSWEQTRALFVLQLISVSPRFYSTDRSLAQEARRRRWPRCLYIRFKLTRKMQITERNYTWSSLHTFTRHRPLVVKQVKSWGGSGPQWAGIF